MTSGNYEIVATDQRQSFVPPSASDKTIYAYAGRSQKERESLLSLNTTDNIMKAERYSVCI